MKKVYLSLMTIAVMFVSVHTASAQAIITFTGSQDSNWNNSGNWDSGIVPNGNDTNDTLVIATNQLAYIVGTITLSSVVIKVMPNASLQLGDGTNNGILTLDNTSAISLQFDGTNRGVLNSLTTANTGNMVTLGGVTVFQGGTTYPTNSGSGLGQVTGPARATNITDGFALGSLPVVLAGFSANLAAGNKVTLNWTTQQEINSDRFEAARSSDGINWQPLATVKAAGFSATPKSYSCQDAAPQKGLNLYRLKMIDLDGRFTLSAVVIIRLNALGIVSMYPNPASGMVTIAPGKAPAGSWKVSLINVSGQVVLQQQMSKDQTTLNLPLCKYPAGSYSVEITDGVSVQSSTLLIAHVQ